MQNKLNIYYWELIEKFFGGRRGKGNGTEKGEPHV